MLKNVKLCNYYEITNYQNKTEEKKLFAGTKCIYDTASEWYFAIEQ